MKQTIFQLLKDQGDLTWEQIVTRIAVAALLGAVIFVSYYISHKGTIYSRKFNVSLVILTVLTGTVMIVIGNNIALSLGMVGALSIVRFRTAIKEPMDIAFLFWSIAAGIVLGDHGFPRHPVSLLDHYRRHLLRCGQLFCGGGRQLRGVFGAAVLRCSQER